MILPSIIRRSCLLVGLLATTAFAAKPASENSQQRDFFEQKIRPLLVRHCYECHGAKKQEAGLRLDTRDAWREGGDGGPVIIPGDPENSRLIAAVKQDDPDLKMPPGGKKLRPDEITDLEQWIRQGAIDPRLTAANAPAPRMGLKEAREFWSFQPVKKPSLPVPQ
ncbi:MAG: c-type cytochrome domain-containing protein, partial [Pirellulaceae bacterium]|nr:c-type cytochrome domain-containing protein [Pirellulaceae bacterium]